MGRIITPVELQNFLKPEHKLKIRAFVDTAAGYLTLPLAWKEKLGELRSVGEVTTQFADQREGTAEVFGAVLLKIPGFREIITEVLFLEMHPDEDGNYEPLLGYIPLEQANAAVDMQNHKLIPIKYVDLK